MSQKLIIPFKKSMMLIGYKNPEYQKHWGYPHYGVDISTIQGGAGDDPTVYASGDGDVVAVGKDNTLGYGIAVRHLDCVSRDGAESDVILRYMHLKSAAVKAGDKVKAGDILGVEGKEGTDDYHLHLEIDTDTKYPTYTPQVGMGHTFWRQGIDSTVNPSLWLWVGEDQELVSPTYNPAWLNKEDFNIPPADDVKKEAEGMYMYAPIWIRYEDETPCLYDKNLTQIPSEYTPAIIVGNKPPLSELEPFDIMAHSGLEWWLEDEEANIVYEFPKDYEDGKPIPYGADEPAPSAPDTPNQPENTPVPNNKWAAVFRVFAEAFNKAADIINK